MIYLSDLFENLSKLNLPFLGENTNVLTLISRIDVFIQKLS